MVFTVAVRMGERRTDRRTVLAGLAGLAALAACQRTATPAAWNPGPRSAESVLVEAVAMAARHSATIAAHPELAGRLTELRDAHLAHADLLARTLGRRDLASPSGSASPAPPAVPADAAAATSGLLVAEKNAADQARSACLAAPGWQAATLGAICAGRATHVAALTR